LHKGDCGFKPGQLAALLEKAASLVSAGIAPTIFMCE
jgi:hypothetical protein